MRPSEKYPVPSALALLFDFVNSLDVRRFVVRSARHATGDELATVSQLEDWLRDRGLLDADARLDREDYRNALDLREALRSFLQLEPAARAGDSAIAARLDAATVPFPLVLQRAEAGKLTLRPTPGSSSGLGRVLAELHHLSETDRLDRMKMCASDECRWIFYDRSKPGSRRWCSSALCGNRQKTRAYRQRKREGDR